MISFLSSASAHSFSSLLGSCLMPCIGKLKTKLWRKMSAVGWWHCFGKKKKVSSTGGCTPDFDLIHFLPATRMRIICFNIGRSEKRSLTAFWDGKWLVETAVVAGATHQKMEKGWKRTWKLNRVFVSLALTTVTHLIVRTLLKPALCGAGHGHSVISGSWEISFLQTEIKGDVCQEQGHMHYKIQTKAQISLVHDCTLCWPGREGHINCWKHLKNV